MKIEDIKKSPSYITPNFVTKGWGHELWIANNDKYCCKILHFNPNTKFSMHYHMIKDETWFVQTGEFIFRWINGDNAEIIETILKKGDTVQIHPGLPHQLESVNGGDIIEVSTEHFDEDSIRISKGNSQLNI